MPPLRIALLGPYPLSDRRILGGVEAVLAHLADALQRRGDLEVHVVVSSAEATADATARRGDITVHAVRPRRTPRWTLLRANARALAAVLARIRPDVVHAHGSNFFADAALRSGRPAVITLHGIIWREAEVARQDGLGWRQRLSWAYDVRHERWCLGRARDLIAISPYVLEAYQGLTRARVHVIENPVSDAYFAAPETTEPATVLCAARIMPRKNILNLLQAFARLHREVPQARLRLAGETTSHPAYVDQCRQFVEAEGLGEAVTFLGWLQEAEMRHEYERCTCLALTSWQETASIAIEQAMAAGRPVLASDVGGSRHLLADGAAGILVAPDDVGGMAEGLNRLLTDADLRQRLGHRGRQEAQRRFQADAVAEQTAQLYRQVLHEQRKPV